MGEVYLALDTELGREVAIKVLPAAFAGDADRSERLRREAKVLAALHERPARCGDLQISMRRDPLGRADVHTRIAVDDHVVRAVLYMASLPLDANVLFMTVMATDMPLVGRG